MKIKHNGIYTVIGDVPDMGKIKVGTKVRVVEIEQAFRDAVDRYIAHKGGSQ